MSRPVSEDVKRNVRAVLLSKVGGVPMSRFIKDYRSLVLEQLDYKDLGFQTLQVFFKSMPEIARLEKVDSDINIFGVGDPNTYLPIGARKAQGKLPKDYHKKLKAGSESSVEEPAASLDSEEMEKLEPDNNGWYSLCCPIEKAPSLDRMELENVFIQAGPEVNLHTTKKWLFVRYKSKEEVQKALDIFGSEFGLQIPYKNTKATGNGPGVEEKKGPLKMTNGLKSKKHQPVAEEKKKHRQAGETKLNGYVSCDENGNKKHRKDKDVNTALFVNGIKDKAAFLELIEPYKPLDVHFAPKSRQSDWWYGFVKMQTAEETKTVIADLNKKQLGDTYIIVDYDTCTDKGKKEDDKSDGQAKSKQRPQKQAEKNNVPNMPRLVHEGSIQQDPHYYKDCAVFVGNFPANTTLFALQDAFSKYHIKDIIITVNNFNDGCTKAFLYLSSITDVIHCVEEMNSRSFNGYFLKVDVPYKNEKMRYVLRNRLLLKTQEEQAAEKLQSSH